MRSRRFFRALALAVMSIAILDLMLWKLIVSRLDPALIRYNLNPRPGEIGANGEFSMAGALVWLGLLAVWAGALAYLQGFASKRPRTAAATCLFSMQSLVILVFHPLLLPMIVGGNRQSGILGFLSRWDVLAEIYGDWGLSRNLHWVFACQLAGTLAVLAAVHLLKVREGPNDSRSLAGQDAQG